MTTGAASAGQDLVDDADETLPEPDLQAPLEKAFQPWHRPRKHFIRLRQWCDEVSGLLADLTKKRGGTAPERISYLTLPGDEMLDIRVLHDTCMKGGVRLRYLGFNTPKGGARNAESNLSQSEVQKMVSIDGPGSRVLYDRLELMTVPRSIADGAIRSEAPFDIVNLDFCESIADDPPRTKESTLEAIKQLLEIQRNRRADPWLLFITTRVGTDVVDTEVWNILLKVIAGNIKSSESFAAALDGISLNRDPAGWRNDHSQFYRGFIIGLGKWMLGLSTTARPHWKVELLSSYGYAVAKPMDLLSLSFRFELIVEPMIDNADLVSSATGTPVDEHELASQLAAKAGCCTDVDAELGGDAHLREDMIAQSAELLSTVRYSADAYHKWLKSLADDPPHG